MTQWIKFAVTISIIVLPIIGITHPHINSHCYTKWFSFMKPRPSRNDKGLVHLHSTQSPNPTCAPYPHDERLYDAYPMSAMYYYGVTVSDPLVRIFRGSYTRWPEAINSLQIAYALERCSPIRQFFYPLVGVVEFAAVITVRNGRDQATIYELDPFIGFRWANFPWNDYVTTSLLIGEGISYASSVPSLEGKNPDNNTKRLLNYLRLEATLALPSYPRLQLVPLIHHRSGAYGLYGAENTGSNEICLGLKYLFQ